MLIINKFENTEILSETKITSIDSLTKDNIIKYYFFSVFCCDIFFIVVITLKVQCSLLLFPSTVSCNL